MDQSRARVLPKWYSRGRFDGKTVMVTGAAQGIGQTVATRIAAEGGTVAVVDRSELVIGEAAALEAAGCHAFAVTADLETWEGAARRPTGARANWAKST